VQLIVSNAIRLATVNVVGGVLLFLGKVAVAAGCGLVALAMSRMPYYNDATAYPATFLSSAILPIAVAVITGYIVAQVRGVTAGECGRCVAACGMAAVASPRD
jgi:choline transporter-like protein 2/4/5